jgi:tRNA(Ile2) C34 agmatinyltransferase TiaS
MILVITPSCKWLKDKGIIGKKERRELAALMAQQDSIRVADSIKKAQDRLLAIEMARLDSIKVAEEEKIRLENENRYNIIVGSFITPEYARSFSDEFRSRGYNVKILKLEGTQFEMVAAEGHKNFRTAVERLRQFQDTVAFDAWLYILK